MSALLELERVTIGYRRNGRWLEAVRDVSLRIEAGASVGLVGESGSGKSTLALAVLRYLPKNGRVLSGSVRFAGRDLAELTAAEVRSYWRERVKLVPQNPLPSLNPAHTVGRQLLEVIDPERPSRSGRMQAMTVLEQVGLADPERVAASYPHQLSGGMQQRVMIAMALAAEPDLLVLDEPTTNLDVTTEATILDLVRDLVRARGTTVLYVSHNLGVVAQLCEQVAVLYAGSLVEEGPVDEVYEQPLHPYTQGLLDSVPTVGQTKRSVSLRPIPGRIPLPSELPPGCLFAPRCPLAIEICHTVEPPRDQPDAPAGQDQAASQRAVRCHRWLEIERREIDPHQPLPAMARSRAEDTVATPPRPAGDVLALRGVRKWFRLRRTLFASLLGRPAHYVHAVDGVDLNIPRGRTVGVVGESGSGKSTLARVIIGLEPATDGSLLLDGEPLHAQLERRELQMIRRLQMVFQSSDEALNPYHTVGSTLERPLHRLSGLSRSEARRRVADLLEAVRLEPSYRDRRPAELSGGEKQRVAIARAFAAQPELLLFDESVSGLDVSVQAAILNLLADLQEERHSSYLFISHDLSVVSYLADEVAVVYLGKLMQVGPTEAVLEPPYHPYTEALLSAIPVLDRSSRRPTIRLQGEVPSPVAVPSGCRFHTRCPRFLGEICRQQEPPWQQHRSGKRIYCHIPLEELESDQEPIFAFSAGSATPDNRSPAAADGDAGDGSADGSGDGSAGASGGRHA